jgi:hypothetical protein
MSRGRPPEPGKIYYLGRLRYRPGADPPELCALLDEIEQAGPVRRRAILVAALLGGAGQAHEAATAVEDCEVTELMGDLLGGL